MKEQSIQAKIIKYLESKGCYVVKIVMSNRSGTPDILACRNGKFLAFEVKRPETINNVSFLQKWAMRKIEEAGGKSYVVCSVEEVEKILEQEDK